jgi:hypothetical protein
VRVTLSRRFARGDIPLRGALLMPLCALAVHQLRFYLVFGSHAPAVLQREGHGYLGVVEPALVLLAALGLGWFAGRLALAGASRPGGSLARPPAGGSRPGGSRIGPPAGGILRTWLVCVLLLFAIYCCQELFEGFLSPGHPAGIAGVLGQGGWTAAPISLLIGAVLAIALRVADHLLEVARRRQPHLWTSSTNDAAEHPEHRSADWRLDPAAGVAAGRAPPRALLPSLI